MAEMVEVEDLNTPGRIGRGNADKYTDMRAAFEKVLPRHSPGLTQSEMREAVRPHLSDKFFPGGKTSGWWAKTVQVDLEARGLLTRETTRPLRWHWA